MIGHKRAQSAITTTSSSTTLDTARKDRIRSMVTRDQRLKEVMDMLSVCYNYKYSIYIYI